MNCYEMFVKCAIPTRFNILGTLFGYKHLTTRGVSVKCDSVGQYIEDSAFELRSLIPRLIPVGKEII